MIRNCDLYPIIIIPLLSPFILITNYHLPIYWFYHILSQSVYIYILCRYIYIIYIYVYISYIVLLHLHIHIYIYVCPICVIPYTILCPMIIPFIHLLSYVYSVYSILFNPVYVSSISHYPIKLLSGI